MPALADILLERFDYQADCLPISRPLNPTHAHASLLPLTLHAERISCAHRSPISPRSFCLHSVRAYERFNGLLGGGMLASTFSLC